MTRGEGTFSLSDALGDRWSIFERRDVTAGLISLPCCVLIVESVSIVLPVEPSSQLLSSSNTGELALVLHGVNALTWVTYYACFGLLL